MKIMLCCLLLAIMFSAGHFVDEGTQPFRIVPIPSRDNGYSTFDSVVLTSQEDLDAFLRNASTQIAWDISRLVSALRNAKLDFTQEALVLLRHSEGSGSVRVTFETPVLKDSTLHCEIRGIPIPPGYGGTTDMAYYCFALAVSKSRVRQVELQAVEGGFAERRLAPVLLPIIEGKQATTLLQSPIEQNQNLQCPKISVICPDISFEGNTPITFKADVTGGKPYSEVSYGWSVNKGQISMGQGTAAIQVEVTRTELAGLTATVEIGGFDPNCPRVASCSPAIP